MKKVYEKPSVEVLTFNITETISDDGTELGPSISGEGVEDWSFRRDMDERAEIPD